VSQSAADRVPIAAAVIVVDGRLLLVRRRVAEGALVWQFPAGKVEPGESAEDAAIREAGEETGLTVRAVRRLGQRVHPLTGRTMTYLACAAVAGTARVAAEQEVAEVVWCDRVTLTTYIPDPLFEPVQEYLDATLRQWSA